MTTIHCAYDGALRCSSRHGPSSSLVETDAPIDNQGKGERFSPTDLVATALATCILTVMGIVAQRHGWNLEGASAQVNKTMTTEGVRKIALLEVWIALPAHLDDRARAVLREAGEGCPVKRSLEGAVPMALHWSSLPSENDHPPSPSQPSPSHPSPSQPSPSHPSPSQPATGDG
jgi:putative redox protein